jgi:ABC-type branched-subunit amino acid transport system permease subunit
MSYLIAGLAAYKAVHLLDLSYQRPTAPWVKIAITVLFSYVFSFVLNVPQWWITALAVATIAGACHALMRLIILAGDYAHRKTLK